MKIIIVGCGKVGTTLVEQLSAEGHDIVVIDPSSEKLDAIANACDVMTVEGNGSSFAVLQEAGVEDADLFIAVTGSDEMNLLCCLFAKKTGHCHTIARVRNSIYSKEIDFIKEQMGLSMIINPELTTSSEIARILRFPSAIKIDTFAKGRVELIKFKVIPEFKLDGLKIFELAPRLKCDILVCAVERGEEVMIPKGNFELKDGDILSIMASHQKAEDFFRKIGADTQKVRNALIIGGGRVAHYLTMELLESGIQVRIIEKDLNRCEYLSEQLPKANIIHGDGTDQKLLMEEGLSNAESVLALTGIDEENLLLSLFAMKHSKAKTIAKVNQIAFNDIISGLDIGSVVYPKYVTSNEILKYVRAAKNTRGSSMETLYKILDNRAEALEFPVYDNCPVAGIPLMELNLKDNLLLCCINRKGSVIIPRGQDKMLPGDTVMIVTTQTGLDDIAEIVK